MKIYLAKPISGCDYKSTSNYFNVLRYKLINDGWDVLSPMTGKDELRTEIKLKAYGYDNVPVATNHAIIERDLWMVEQSNVVYCNLFGTQIVSIGSIMELAWAHLLRKHTVVVMEKDNIHQHAFVIESADIIFETEEEALSYLHQLIRR